MVFSGFKYFSQSLQLAELALCVSQLLILFNFSSLLPTSLPRTSLYHLRGQCSSYPNTCFLSGKKKKKCLQLGKASRCQNLIRISGEESSLDSTPGWDMGGKKSPEEPKKDFPSGG